MVPGATIVNSIKENADEIHAINPRTPDAADRNRLRPKVGQSLECDNFPPYINSTVTRDCPLRFRRGGGESFSQNPKKSAKLRQAAVCGMSYSVRVNGKSEWIF